MLIIFFKKKSEIKMFSDKQKLKEFFTGDLPYDNYCREYLMLQESNTIGKHKTVGRNEGPWKV